MQASKYLANICLHKSTNHKFYRFFEEDEDLCKKIREDMTGGPSVFITWKAVVDRTYIRNSSNFCKKIIGIDASQLYPFSLCQEMPTGLYTWWEYDSETDWFQARNNRTRNFDKNENMVMSFYQELRPACKIESSYTTKEQKIIECFNVDGYCDQCKTVFEAMGCYYHFDKNAKNENMVMSFYQELRPACKIESSCTTEEQKIIECFNVDGYCDQCKTVFEAMGCYYHFCSCQETRPSLSEQDHERGNKKREMDELRR